MCVQEMQQKRGGGFLVIHEDDIPIIENIDGKIVTSKWMVSHLIRYEGLKTS